MPRSSPLREASATPIPSAWKARATAAPTPRLAPVMNAALSVTLYPIA